MTPSGAGQTITVFDRAVPSSDIATSSTAIQRVVVADQLVSVVRPLATANGSHTLTLELHPADLGRVRLEITVEGAMVHIAMDAEHGLTAQLLRDALPELRRALDAAGLSTGRIDLDRGLNADPSRSSRADANSLPAQHNGQQSAQHNGQHNGQQQNDFAANSDGSERGRRAIPDTAGHEAVSSAGRRTVLASTAGAPNSRATTRRSVDLLL